MSTTNNEFARERQLIEKLELRIASAATAAKLQEILSKFLAPLLLKLASTDVDNRNLTIKICQYINQRLKIDQTIQLPIEALSKVLKDATNPFIKQFTRVFLQQGLARLSQKDAYSVLPTVLQSSFAQDEADPTDAAMWAIGFDLLLRVLKEWQAPQAGTEAELLMIKSFELSSHQIGRVAKCLSQFLLYEPKENTSMNLPTEMQQVCQQRFQDRKLIVPNIASFIQSPLFDVKSKFLPALILLVDANETASSRADTIFKQNEFDLESEDLVRAAFDLYPRGKSRLRAQILSLLTKSKLSTTHMDRILSIVESQLQTATLDREAAKLRSNMFTYLFWTIRCNPNLGAIATSILAHLKEFVEMQGWPAPNSTSQIDMDLRAKAYESIGLLAASTEMNVSQATDAMDIDSASDPYFSLVSWLFTSLRCDTTRDIRHSIEQSLSRLMSKPVTAQLPENGDLNSLLRWNFLAREGDVDPLYHAATISSSQYVALRFMNSTTSYSDVDARILNIIALGSQRKEIVEEGQRGLDPTWHAKSFHTQNDSVIGASQPPDFKTVLLRIKQLASESTAVKSGISSPGALTALVAFCRNSIATHAWKDKDYVSMANEDWPTQVDQALDHNGSARASFKSYLKSENPDSVASLLMYSFEGFSKGSAECGRLGLQLTSVTPNSVIERLSATVSNSLRVSSASKTNQHNACKILAIISSALPDWELTVEQAFKASDGWKTAVGHELAQMEIDFLYAAYTLSRVALRHKLPGDHPMVQKLAERCKEIIIIITDKSFRESAYHALGQFALCLQFTSATAFDIVALLDQLLKDAKKESEPAILAMGRVLSLCWPGMDQAAAEDILARIYELHEIKKPEVQFALGEALATASLRFCSTSTVAELDVDVESPPADTHPNLYRKLLTDIVQQSKTTKPALKKATGIWLLSLVQFCADDTLVQPFLRECQEVFSRLLTNRDEIAQETGSRGLGIVYEKGDKELREDLVRELVQSFTGNNVKTAGTVTEDTQLFEAGTLPTENGQSITTYKDIVSLAQEMGDPSLVYRFMNLASNNAIWSSRAAFGRFGLSGVLADSSYLQENEKFYPKLFRYRFDPNPNVQRSMNDIWKALVKDSQAVVDKHFDLIIQDLLKSILSGREWRAREASCAAISDLIQGREIEKFEKYLDDIWNVAFKVLDDIKESVRAAAMKMCRTLTSMLIRNLEIGEGTGRRAVTMLNHAMPFLLQQMEGASGQDVQQYAIVTLLDIVKKAPPRTIESFAPTILETLINSLSSLEHESINYLHLNADKYGLTAEKLDNMRVSSIGISPVSEAIEKCLDSLASASIRDANGSGSELQRSVLFEDALQRLESCFKTSIGLPSRVGLTRAVITLVVRHHAAFRPYADRFARLCRKNILDRNSTISQSFITALAYCLRLTSEKEVRQTLTYAEKLYFESQEMAHRSVAGEILQAISKASNDVFTNFAALFLPFTFIGREDTEDNVKDRFETAWKDNVGGTRAARLYLKEIAVLVQKHITSSLWPIRHACCFAVASLITMIQIDGPFSAEEADTLWSLTEEALNGKTWVGKERIVESWPKFVKASHVLWPRKTAQMVKISVREAKRTNPVYRPYALKALAEFSRVRPDLDISAEVVPFLVEIVENSSYDQDVMDIDNAKSGTTKDANDASRVRLLSSTITCLFANIRPMSPSTALEQALDLIKLMAGEIADEIQSSVYREAKTSLDDSQTNNSKTAGIAMREAEQATSTDVLNGSKLKPKTSIFWSGLATVLFGPGQHATYDSGTERLREHKVELASTLSSSGLVDSQSRQEMQKTLTLWLSLEHSRPLRSQLEKTILQLSNGLSVG